MIRLAAVIVIVALIAWNGFTINRELRVQTTETQVDGMVFCTWIQGDQVDTLQEPCPKEVTVK